MNESSVERFLVKSVKSLGGYAIKLAPTISGLPDRLVILPNGIVRFAELKAPGGHARPQQLLWQKRLKELGFESAILNSKEAVKDFLSNGEPS